MPLSIIASLVCACMILPLLHVIALNLCLRGHEQPRVDASDIKNSTCQRNPGLSFPFPESRRPNGGSREKAEVGVVIRAPNRIRDARVRAKRGHKINDISLRVSMVLEAVVQPDLQKHTQRQREPPPVRRWLQLQFRIRLSTRIHLKLT